LACVLIGVEAAAAGVSTTLAFAIAAPEGSLICPRNAPVAVCATALEDRTIASCKNEKTNMKYQYFRNFIQYSIL
jgi:hypothetical protein